MPREAKYDVLFEPIQIGPHTLKNRFWQVPHCNGAGSDKPGFQAAFRGMKAEGGWSAVFTEVCTIAPGGDVMPWVASKLWDAGDVRNLRQMTDAIHAHGALAGVELCHPGGLAANAETRAPGKVVSQIASDINYLANGRALTKREIAALRREHVEGFKRAKDAGFDLLTFYAGNWARSRSTSCTRSTTSGPTSTAAPSRTASGSPARSSRTCAARSTASRSACASPSTPSRTRTATATSASVRTGRARSSSPPWTTSSTTGTCTSAR